MWLSENEILKRSKELVAYASLAANGVDEIIDRICQKHDIEYEILKPKHLLVYAAGFTALALKVLACGKYDVSENLKERVLSACHDGRVEYATSQHEFASFDKEYRQIIRGQTFNDACAKCIEFVESEDENTFPEQPYQLRIGTWVFFSLRDSFPNDIPDEFLNDFTVTVSTGMWNSVGDYWEPNSPE